MKKLSLLLALAMFGFGSATMVNAEPDTSSTETSEDVSEIMTPEEEAALMDRDGDGIVSEEERAAFEAGTPAE